MEKKIYKLSTHDIDELEGALCYLHMPELKEICQMLNLSKVDKKGDIIRHIIHFLKSGVEKKVYTLPDISKAKKNISYPIALHGLILSGSYKNDEATREFMKKIIGAHFHFTAFGQQWIKERWMQGDPPTYKEFAQFWSQEYLARKDKKATPNKEWAYLNFMQVFAKLHPDVSSDRVAQEWHTYRSKQKEKALMILKKIKAKL